MSWLAAVKNASANPGSVFGAWYTIAFAPGASAAGLLDVQVGLAGARGVARRARPAVDVVHGQGAPVR